MTSENKGELRMWLKEHNLPVSNVSPLVSFDFGGKVASGKFTGAMAEGIIFEGPKGKERKSQIFSLVQNDDRSYKIANRTDFIYDNERLVASYFFFTHDLNFKDAQKKTEGIIEIDDSGRPVDDNAFTGKLAEITLFEGDPGQEKEQDIPDEIRSAGGDEEDLFA